MLSILINKASDENLTGEDWATMMEICDQINSKPDLSKECVSLVSQKLLHKNPNVRVYGLCILDACIKNCGFKFHEQVVSRSLLNILLSILVDSRAPTFLKNKLTNLMIEWRQEFMKDSRLSYYEETFQQLKMQGFLADNKMSAPITPKPTSKSKEEEEEEELQMALAISLSEEENRRKSQEKERERTSGNVRKGSVPKPNVKKELFKVKALYDFVAQDSGEVGFLRDDIIIVYDATHPDWWEGEVRNRTGLFPSNYVVKLNKSTEFDLNSLEQQVQPQLVDQLLGLLQRVDPSRDSIGDNDQIQHFYQSSLLMKPKVVNLIEFYAKRKDDLIILNEKLKINLEKYENIMKSRPQLNYSPAPTYQPVQNYPSMPNNGISQNPYQTNYPVQGYPVNPGNGVSQNPYPAPAPSFRPNTSAPYSFDRKI
ncbi:hypothetical protein ROZALSC1DRAFT_28505 [Rozella allomycis CSF55]|uniref:Class E vacuolar protein-sorting machinery protein HSE1 n=1 Tax=Rozella allomycis (strain CSF55) TaxID=988480 RepID=A0A4P9YMY2_ROZAC|nr:hypothetical protein ROZALSC1DRAFT_28505 [Rozella allomycis CSF55]